MRDDLSDFDGTPAEFAHLAEAMRGVRAWLKSDSGWGKPDPVIDPNPPMSDQPGIDKEHTETKRKPSSTAPGYLMGSTGKKSHHKPAAEPAAARHCPDCGERIGGNWRRCPKDAKIWRHRKDKDNQPGFYLARKAAKQAAL